MSEEIKIITLGDIFKNLETEEQAFKLLNYIINLQEENKKLKETIKATKEKVIEIQDKYNYMLEDIIFMLAKGIDYE